ncbi:hypothetical protein [Nonomuraea sp. NPDC050310]
MNALKEIEPDPHEVFLDVFTPAAPVKQDPEERRLLIARLAAM